MSKAKLMSSIFLIFLIFYSVQDSTQWYQTVWYNVYFFKNYQQLRIPFQDFLSLYLLAL